LGTFFRVNYEEKVEDEGILFFRGCLVKIAEITRICDRAFGISETLKVLG
jgi:hypothetical protein